MGRRFGKYRLSSRKTWQEFNGIEMKLGRDLTTNRRVTAIVFDIETLSNGAGVRELVKFEVGTLFRTGDHPNIAQLVDVLASSSKIVVIMESVSGGDLFEAIVAEGSLDEGVARHYFGQILDAIEHCHSVGVCHRDIKPENVLLDKRGNAKLTGFALAGLFEPSMGDHASNLMHASCGTPAYVAPEVVQGLGYDGRAADVWSLGVTLYVMLAGFSPFQDGNFPAAFEKAQAGDFMFAPGMSKPACSLLECMLEPDPRKRYTVEQVRSHRWYTQQRGHPPQWAQAVAEGNCGRRQSGTGTAIDHGVDGRGYPCNLGSIRLGALEVAAGEVRRSERVEPARKSPSILPSGEREAGSSSEPKRRSQERRSRSRSRGLPLAVGTFSACDSLNGNAGSTAGLSISNDTSVATKFKRSSCGDGSSSEVVGVGSWCDGSDGKDISSAESEGEEENILAPVCCSSTRGARQAGEEE